MKLRISGGTGCLLALGLLASNAWATISLTPGSSPICTGNQTSTAQIQTYINTNCGVPLGALYKADVDPSGETGAFAGSYQTTFGPGGGDVSWATIAYTGGGAIQADPVYILVKDGNHSPAWYLFRTSWDGEETIELTNFWPQGGSISHVAVYGHHVPDGGVTLTLLGGALVGLETLRRRLAR